MGASGSVQASLTPQAGGGVRVALRPMPAPISDYASAPFLLSLTNTSKGSPEEGKDDAVTRGMVTSATGEDEGVGADLRQSVYNASVYRGCPKLSDEAATPTIALLQASPLMHSAQPAEVLDLKSERDAIISSLQRAGRGVRLACEVCTTKRLRSLLTACSPRVLHYSGHGCMRPRTKWEARRARLCGEHVSVV